MHHGHRGVLLDSAVFAGGFLESVIPGVDGVAALDEPHP